MQSCILMLALQCAFRSAMVPLAAAHGGRTPFVAARRAMLAVPAVGVTPARPRPATQFAIVPLAAPVWRAPTFDPAFTLAPLDTPTRRPRPRPIEYSDWYARRLLVHRVGSYAMLPLFVAEYPLGRDLLYGTNVSSWEKPAHAVVAGAIGGLFAINTVTGVWNLWDSRHDPSGRTRRWVHASLLLASDAGFVWTGVLGAQSKRSFDTGRRHRDVAIASMSLATVGTALMWFWRD